jgi:NAD+ synthase
MARCRMIVLYDLSAEGRGLVIGTSNKTEILLGYSTQFGDSASALNPLGDLYKHQVWQLARHLGLPASVIEKAPSADLFEGQTDENELGFTYAEVDRLLVRMIDERCSRDELVREGFAPEFVDKVARRIALNQYKRLPPVIAKLSPRSVNHDFRYLRSWGH